MRPYDKVCSPGGSPVYINAGVDNLLEQFRILPAREHEVRMQDIFLARKTARLASLSTLMPLERICIYVFGRYRLCTAMRIPFEGEDTLVGLPENRLARRRDLRVSQVSF